MILSTEKYSQLREKLLFLIQTELRTVTIEDSLEWDIPLDTLQSIFAQILKRYIQSELGNALYGNDVMKRAVVRIIDNVEIERCVKSSVTSSSSSSSSPPCDSNNQIYTILNNIVNAPTPLPPSIPKSGGRGSGGKFSSPFPSPPSSSTSQPAARGDVQQLYRDLLRLIALCPYNLANLYLKYKFPTDPKMSIAKFLIQPDTTVPNSIPRKNLFYLIGHDILNAPDIDLMKEHVGKEYENMLEKLLKNRHMEFETEEDSRRKGRQKTPDILFTIPMAVRLPPMYHSADQRNRRNTDQYEGYNHNETISNSSSNTNMSDLVSPDQHRRSNRSESFDLCFHLGNSFPSDENLSLSQASATNLQNQSNTTSLSDPPTNSSLLLSPLANTNKISLSPPRDDEQYSQEGSYLIVNWIDSKALFADSETFEENISQFRTYTNRYGRGMVIYWQGFCEDILNHSVLSMNDDILVCDQFPDDWLFPTGEPADGRRPLFDDIILPLPPEKVV